MYYHIRINLTTRVQESKFNITFEELEERYLSRYRKGEDFTLNGRVIKINDIQKMSINVSENENELDILVDRIEYEDQKSPLVRVGGPSRKWRAAGRLKDVSDELLEGPPGYMLKEVTEVAASVEVDNTKVFIVHGHDDNLKQQLEIFLNGIGIKPVVLHREANEGLTVLEKFEKHSDVQYAFVLLTPDDIGCSVKERAKSVEEYSFRARQNVIFELGFFIGKLGRAKVCTLYKEGVELPNDISGLVYQKVNDNIEDVGYHIMKELRAAGLKVTY
ncbi:TPA: nucleotide-binding protein [Bacillus thuringiensis]|nr:nucleotide-binding protein [Bacillus thuringiensis]